MDNTEIEGLVSRLTGLAKKFDPTPDYPIKSELLKAVGIAMREAADALSQTIPRTDGNTITVSRMTLEWIAKKCADKRNPQVAFVVSKLLAGEALSALRGMADDAQTIPHTDSVDAVIDDYLGGLRWQASDAGAHNDKKGAEHARIKIEAINELRSMLATIPRTTDEGMRVILAEECHRLGDVDGAANILAKAEPDFPVWSYAALAAMRRVSKTDEGRNAVIEECARAAHAKRSECDEAFYETNGSIYTEAYLDGISAAYDAIRALTTGGKL